MTLHAYSSPVLVGVSFARAFVSGINFLTFARRTVVVALLSLIGAVPAGAASLTLQWDPPNESQTIGYIVLYGTKSGAYTARLDVGLQTLHRVQGLAEGTKYCFAVQAYNRAGDLSAPSSEVCGATANAPTSGGSAPPPPSGGSDSDPAPADIVLYAADVGTVKGHWSRAGSSGAAGGEAMRTPDSGWSSTGAPLASPAHYFEVSFSAPANTPYNVWLRLRAAGDSKWNDSVWVQFSDALVSGSAAYRIGTTSGLLVNLERCAGCGTSAWGWQNTAYWLSQPTTVTFAASGSHTLRVQTREDGVEIDQVILSPATYASKAPGAITNDTTIVPKPPTGTPPPPPPPPAGSTPYSGSPAAVPGTIEAVHFDNGGSGVAYSDSTPGNTGGAFRSSDVDLEASSGGGFNVGWTAPGEWLAYTVNVASAGDYVARFRVASIGGGAMQVAFASPSAATKSLTVPNTGAWQAWTTVDVPVTLAAGPQRMTVTFTTDRINLRSIALSASSAPTPAPAPAPPPPTSGGQTLVVNAGGNLQAALNAAKPGDTILLQAGATFVGNFVLPARSDTGTSYITIRSSAPDSALPGEGVRITPGHASQLPKLRSPNTAAALATAPGAHHYRLQFLEFLANAQAAGNIIALGGGASEQRSLGEVPHHLILDRVYIHGDAATGQRRGIALNSASTTIVNSHISDIKASNTESQAIAGWNGPGPFVITNNYLEAAAENILFGGADPGIQNLVPSDITITRNHLAKPLAWRSQNWMVKNLFELKNAQRVVIDGNLFENNWQAAQSGYAILMKSVNQDGSAPWSVVQEVTFTNNVVRNVAAGVAIAKVDEAVTEINRITIRNNFFDNVSRATYGGSGAFLLMLGGSDVTVDHNTVISDGGSVVIADAYPARRFEFTNNIVIDGGYGIKGSGAASGAGTISRYFPNGVFLGGIYIGTDPKQYPSGNYYPASMDAVGFVNHRGGDYRLSSSSIYRGGGSDGTDPGCNVDAISRAQRP